MINHLKIYYLPLGFDGIATHQIGRISYIRSMYHKKFAMIVYRETFIMHYYIVKMNRLIFL